MSSLINHNTSSKSAHKQLFFLWSLLVTKRSLETREAHLGCFLVKDFVMWDPLSLIMPSAKHNNFKIPDNKTGNI